MAGLSVLDSLMLSHCVLNLETNDQTFSIWLITCESIRSFPVKHRCALVTLTN